jgi:hypothetical protein
MWRYEIPWDELYEGLVRYEPLTEMTDVPYCPEIQSVLAALARNSTCQNFEQPVSFPNFNTITEIFSLRFLGADRCLPLLDLLSDYAHTGARKARDHFFALQGIATDANEDGFAVDYESPLEVVVRRHAEVLVRRGKTHKLLRTATGKRDSERCPSWIPDWLSQSCLRKWIRESQWTKDESPSQRPSEIAGTS